MRYRSAEFFFSSALCERVPSVVLAALLSGCAASPSPASRAAAADLAPAAAAPIESIWPISPTHYRTTSAEIYLGNLDARVSTLEQRVAAGNVDRIESLAGQLYHRYKVLGRLDDAERALKLLGERADQDQLTSDGMVLYAIALSGMHQFDDAERWLERARQAGAKPAAWRDVRNDILVARGEYDELAQDLQTSAEPIADFYALAHRADLRLLQGDLNGATRQYLTAQTLYADVSPVPLAWLHTQMGIGYLRHGRIADAKRFFAAAVERLPGYYLAEEHLAECETLLGEFDAARARYLRVIEQTGNPEFYAALAGLERAAGNSPRADRLTEQAKQGYEDLLRRYPSAYAQHAAEFFSETGDPLRAYDLARNNARDRQDIGSLILLATTADAVDQLEVACRARASAVATGLSPPELTELDSLNAACMKTAESSKQ
jgi:thioredoxin-like negative regulator of GroEL